MENPQRTFSQLLMMLLENNMKFLSFEKKDTRTKKIVVLSIWLYALLVLMVLYQSIFNTNGESENNLQSLIVLGLLSFISVSLLFKSKIARFIILVNIYGGLWLSVLFFFFSLYLYLTTDTGLFNIVLQLVGIFFVLLIIYLFSNKEALKLFGIQNSRKDFYWLLGVSILLTFIIVLVYIFNHDMNNIFKV